ncbi:response regulator [Desulfonatronum thioautotrophicum]|uniref:response regulator n=1 Tax=Desulfonatronum thioautotrophicum TaxID=617001 RepID=UPI0005EB2D49|nr:response regulator [Desulfonatronum thioautotrophicum]
MNSASVLVVEHDDELRDALVKRLSRRGMTVRDAYSDQEAMAALRDQPADVILLDMELPERNGLFTLRDIKQEFPKSIVLLLAQYATLESALEGMLLGATDYLLKPCMADEIMIRIQEALHDASAA